MKKALKITWISLASLLGVVILTVIIALWILLSPKRVTAIVNEQAPKFITCDFNIDKVDVTLFKTFPDLGLELCKVVLISPIQGSPSDTLAFIDNCVVSVNIVKFLFDKEIIINEFYLENGDINVFYDAEGNTNIDIMTEKEPEKENKNETEITFPYNIIDLNKIEVKNINIKYTDMPNSIMADIKALAMLIKGNLSNDIVNADFNIRAQDISYDGNADSLVMNVKLDSVKMKGIGRMYGEDLSADMTLGSNKISYNDSDNNNISLNNINLRYNGKVESLNIIQGIMDMNFTDLSMTIADECFVNDIDIEMTLPLALNLSATDATFDDSKIKINDIEIDFKGDASMKGEDIAMNLDVNTNTIDIEKTAALLPAFIIEDVMGNMNVKGSAKIDAHIEGTYNNSQMPVVTASVTYNDGNVLMPDMLPFPLSDINTALTMNLDLNNRSDVTIDNLKVSMNNTSLTLSGNIKDVMNKMSCDVTMDIDTYFDDLRSFIPEDINAEGRLKAHINAKGYMDDFTNMNLMKTSVNGDFELTDLDLLCFDTIAAQSSIIRGDITLPNPNSTMVPNSLAKINIIGNNMNADITNMLTARLENFNFDIHTSDILNDDIKPAIFVDFGFGAIDFTMDDMVFNADNASGSGAMLPSTNTDNQYYIAVFSSDSLLFTMGEDMHFETEHISLDATADYNKDEKELLLQWNPEVNVDLSNALLDMSSMQETVFLPEINFEYSGNKLNINNSNVLLGNSDFELKGVITNINKFLKKEGLLKGDLTFTSSYTDVNEIMDIFNGMGANDTIVKDTPVETNESVETAEEDDPFMVPLGVDITLNTKIESAKAGNMDLANVGGMLTVKDGTLILQEMGFTSNAARMLLTAMYKSPRKNHLYVGLDFHLLDIDIAEMIRIIPDLDTIVPMLKSFSGKAEFHLAAETNLKSNYEPKISTLRGATSIKGKDLVVLDSETFKMISKYLLMGKDAKNQIDSLSVEIGVFKNEVDVYPFLIAMDDYQVAISGRHFLDMTFDYNLSVIRPPIINRLGLDINGSIDNLQYHLIKSKHVNLFKPDKRDHIQEQILRVKAAIAKSLEDNIKE